MATTVNHKSTLRILNVLEHTSPVVQGVLADNTARSTNRANFNSAIAAAISNGYLLWVPPGRYEISGGALIIPSNLRWMGTMLSTIVQFSLSTPVVHVGSPLGTAGATIERTIVDGAELRHNGSATSGGNGIEVTGGYMCTFKNLQIGDVNATLAGANGAGGSVPWMGVFVDDAAGTVPMFSCTWENIRIKHWAYRGFSADRLNYEAATGNVWTNLYIGNGDASGTRDVSATTGNGALVLGSQAQAVFNQLNIEWVKTTSVVRMVVCDQVVIAGVNFEGITLKAPSSQDIGFFDLYYGTLTVEGVTINNCTISTANNAASGSIFRLGPASVVRANNVRPLLMTVTTSLFYVVRSNSATNSRADLGQFAIGNSDGLTAYDDGSFASGAGNGYGELTDFNGAGVRTLSDASATLYSYRGDTVVRIPATTARTLTLSNQCASAIATRIPPGTRKRVRHSGGAGTVTVSNYNSSSIGSIASGASAEFVFDGSDWLAA